MGISPLLTACPCMFVDEVYTTDAVCWNGEHIALNDIMNNRRACISLLCVQINDQQGM